MERSRRRGAAQWAVTPRPTADRPAHPRGLIPKPPPPRSGAKPVKAGGDGRHQAREGGQPGPPFVFQAPGVTPWRDPSHETRHPRPRSGSHIAGRVAGHAAGRAIPRLGGGPGRTPISTPATVDLSEIMSGRCAARRHPSDRRARLSACRAGNAAGGGGTRRHPCAAGRDPGAPIRSATLHGTRS